MEKYEWAVFVFSAGKIERQMRHRKRGRMGRPRGKPSGVTP